MNLYLGYFDNKSEHTKKDVEVVKANTEEEAKIKWCINYINTDTIFKESIDDKYNSISFAKTFYKGCFNKHGNEINSKTTDIKFKKRVREYFKGTDYAESYIDYVHIKNDDKPNFPIEFYMYVFNKNCEKWAGKITIENVEDIAI